MHLTPALVVHATACDVSICPPPHLTLLVQPRAACAVSSFLCSLCPPPPSTLLARPSHVSNTLWFAHCPCYSMRNTVVLVMPAAALVDTVILSQPPPAPIHPPHPWTCVSPGGEASVPAPPHPRSTPTTPSSTSPECHAISGPTTQLGRRQVPPATG